MIWEFLVGIFLAMAFGGGDFLAMHFVVGDLVELEVGYFWAMHFVV